MHFLDTSQLEDYVAATAGARVDRARGTTWQPEPGDLVLVRRLGTKPVQVAEAPDSKAHHKQRRLVIPWILAAKEKRYW